MQPTARRSIATAHDSLRRLNAFVSVAAPTPNAPPQQATSGPLAGVRVAIKDNICTADLPTTCGSRGLQSYRSPFDATVVARLRTAGASLVGKTNLDEFGMGSHSTHSAAGPVRSVYGAFSAGGSSGGSAVAVAAGACDVALGTDTGGSVRLPAAYNRVCGFKPSYGRVSRWGVVAYANSLDTVGVLARTVEGVRAVFGVVDAFDARDPTSLPDATRGRISALVQRPRKEEALRFGVPSEYNTAEVSPVVRRAWARALAYLQSMGHTVHSVSLPTTQQALSAYYILAPAEASSNLAKYDGARYGTPAQAEEASSGLLYAVSRQQGFGDEVRRRILLGSYSLSADAIDNYFIKAQKIRRLVRQDFDKVFNLENILSRNDTSTGQGDEGVDALICPTSADLPPSTEHVESLSPLEAYAGDVFTVPASLAGLPALTVPVKIDNSDAAQSGGPDSVGIQVIAQYGDDENALRIGSLFAPLR